MINRELFHEWLTRDFEYERRRRVEITEGPIKERLNEIFNSLVPLANLDVKPVFVITDSHIENAYARDSGHVVFSTGMFKRVFSDGAIAQVLGHELAHIKLEHMKALTEEYLQRRPYVLSENLESLRYDIGYISHMQQQHPEQEFAADSLGTEWALAAGYPAHEIEKAILAHSYWPERVRYGFDVLNQLRRRAA